MQMEEDGSMDFDAYMEMLPPQYKKWGEKVEAKCKDVGKSTIQFLLLIILRSVFTKHCKFKKVIFRKSRKTVWNGLMRIYMYIYSHKIWVI